jgi:hypothetical protein
MTLLKLEVQKIEQAAKLDTGISPSQIEIEELVNCMRDKTLLEYARGGDHLVLLDAVHPIMCVTTDLATAGRLRCMYGGGVYCMDLVDMSNRDILHVILKGEVTEQLQIALSLLIGSHYGTDNDIVTPDCVAFVYLLSWSLNQYRDFCAGAGNPKDDSLVRELRSKVWWALYDAYPVLFPITSNNQNNPLCIYQNWGTRIPATNDVAYNLDDLSTQ